MMISGRGKSGGLAEGRLLLTKEPFSLVTDVERETGRIVGGDSMLLGKSIKGTIFAFPLSTETQYEVEIIHELEERGLMPKGIVMAECDQILCESVKQFQIPLVDGIDLTLLKEGDEVVVDGTEGCVNLKHVELKSVVTSFLRYQDKILILKRSEKVLTSKGKWAGCSGYVEIGETPEQTAVKEIGEETGIENPVLVRKGGSIFVRGNDIVFEIHTFLFDVDTDNIVLDWEHTEYKWIKPEEMSRFDTVMKLREALQKVLTS